jgi:hypothetical protein
MSDTTLSGVTCSSCGTPGITTNFCPNCGGSVQPSTTPPPGYTPAPPVFAAPAPQPKNTWIKVLIGLGVGLMLLVGGCTALLGTAANEVGKELAEDKTGDVSDPSEVKATASLNEPLSLKGTTYKVTDVRTADSVGDSFTKERANGTFVILNVQLTNEKSEPATIMSDALTLVGGNGSAYSTSDDALLAVDDQFLLEEIQPGLSESGTLIYDVPPSAVDGAELQVEDLFSDEKGRIKLGL